MNTFYRLAAAGLMLSACSFAQEERKYTFDLGFGSSTPLGNTGRHLNEGWSIHGGMGLNASRWLSLKVNLGYDDFGINYSTLRETGASSGSMNVFSATLDPVIHLTPNRKYDFYLTGGGGVYHRHQQFAQPGNGLFTANDPFLQLPAAGVYQVTPYSVNKPGVDAGAGFSTAAGKGGVKAFFEARYNRIFIGSSHTDYLPVTFGLRW